MLLKCPKLYIKLYRGGGGGVWRGWLVGGFSPLLRWPVFITHIRWTRCQHFGCFNAWTDSLFQDKDNTMTRPTIGDILESRGSMSMDNNTFNIETSVDEIPIFSYRSEITGSFLQSSALNFICPRGYNAKPVYRWENSGILDWKYCQKHKLFAVVIKFKHFRQGLRSIVWFHPAHW